jgi:hypothetical protein
LCPLFVWQRPIRRPNESVLQQEYIDGDLRMLNPKYING